MMTPFQTAARIATYAIVALCLHACSSNAPSPENSAWAGLTLTLRGASVDPTSQIQLSPLGWYLKVQAPDSPPTILAFGYVEQHTSPPIEVWYSGSAQYVKIQEGRIVGTHGLPNVNWKEVIATPALPKWASLTGAPTIYKRKRSTSAQYDYGIEDEIAVITTAAPEQPLSSLMAGANDTKARNWRWYREKSITSSRPKLPDSVFATAHIRGATIVVFSKQCLAENYCLTLMRWPQLESEPHPW